MDSDVLSFVRSTFSSVWALDLLLFLRAHADRAWERDELVRELRSSDFAVLRSLDTLTAAGLVLAESETSVRYAPADATLDRRIGEVEQLYRTKPDKVRRAILRPDDSKLQTLADAFKLRKD